MKKIAPLCPPFPSISRLPTHGEGEGEGRGGSRNVLTLTPPLFSDFFCTLVTPYNLHTYEPLSPRPAQFATPILTLHGRLFVLKNLSSPEAASEMDRHNEKVHTLVSQMRNCRSRHCTE